ncbi:hypothetical protein HanPSC8_Chr11g0457211 [Helianthus annuus]|nr:hypothetical protein HanIR_Chr11g0511051 [Helianthus annuus]KAJ0873849.1 hypothetical protein HanPSC8_Chr11g0457211 [Helianthus annuus]
MLHFSECFQWNSNWSNSNLSSQAWRHELQKIVKKPIATKFSL